MAFSQCWLVEAIDHVVIPIENSAPISIVRRAPPTVSPHQGVQNVSFLVSFHRGATQSGILFLVSIERGTSRRVYHRRPSVGSLAPWLWHASV